ncbi:hypothetical protein FHU33_0315 [Blastococcus colisei]|uniref:Uncharacterized protein n=1 Tax=Blastococcus colisei TaxID=1564162 RepID=A0A543PA53_9ACTN|nr:hypothetical protein [Blastococcus colisei]TQN40963.1 hypothetical protein FHU33_0315 [Blastococcus colisei]
MWRNTRAALTRSVEDEEVSVLTIGPDGEPSFAMQAHGVLQVGLNREFLLQALDAGDSGQLVLELDGPIAPWHSATRRGPGT